jgi:hypothetical protein
MGKLEPNLEEIWDFNSWNMAYNLVAELDDSEARWLWIQRAIDYLTHEGLKANPNSAKLMEALSRIYWHKIGRDTDEHHFYYKHRLALNMHGVFLDRDQQDIPAIANAPKDFKNLLADPDVSAALSGFRLHPPEKVVLAINDARNLFDFPKPITEALRGEKYATAIKKIHAYTTARILREQYGMTHPEIMTAMERDYGKFDWRLCDPHAIYWAVLAKITEPKRYQDRQINYDRLLLYSLQATCRAGIISSLSPNPYDPLVTTFDLSKIKPIDSLFKKLLEENPVTNRERPDYRGAESICDGHVQFLQESEFNLYFSGFVSEAQKYHMELYKLYDKPDPYEDLEHTCVGKVKKFVDEAATYPKMRAWVDSLVVTACFDLCMNKAIEAHQKERLAKRAWQAFVDFEIARQEGKVLVPDEEGKKKVVPNAALPTWTELLKWDVSQLLQGHLAGFPPQLIPVLRNILHVPVGAEVNKLDFGEAITPEIPPSSPPPK